MTQTTWTGEARGPQFNPFWDNPFQACTLPDVPKSAFTRKYDRFRALLVEIRQDAGVTQTVLARKLGRPQSFVSKYERGERRLDVVEFLEVTRALRVDPLRVISELRD